MSIALVTMPAFLPTSLASLLFAVITLSVTLMKQQLWPLPLAQKSTLLSLLPQASPRQASQTASRVMWEHLVSLHEADSRHKLVTAISRGQEHPTPIISPTVPKTSKSLLGQSLHRERAVTAVP